MTYDPKPETHQLDQLRPLITSARSIAVLTGAGVSAASVLAAVIE